MNKKSYLRLYKSTYNEEMTKKNSQKPNVYQVLLANDLYIKVNLVLVGDSNNLDTINYSVFNLMNLHAFFLLSADFSQNCCFPKILSGIQSEPNSLCADQG